MKDGALFIEVHLPQAEHVQNYPVRRKGLSAHRVVRPSDTQWEPSLACMLHVMTKLIFGRTIRARKSRDLCNTCLI